MDKTEAARILSDHLLEYRKRSFAELAQLAAEKHLGCFSVTGQSGANYQIEILCRWDSRPGGVIRVLGSIDDGGWRAFIPVTDDFLVPPSGGQ